ncbi:MAG: dipeptidase, partial [Sphingobacteriia bacterium]|nr:dipeptidase [Sphingobacteriia bacterium]
TGIMDYGSLIYTTLQRAKNAREAIKIMTDLVAEYGYFSSGESFSIVDPNEAWILEMIGKGSPVFDKKGKIDPKHYTKGAVWVARRIPDGYISGHANQARITTFPLNDPENCIYSKDVITFARQKGYFTGKDEEFSFADAYAPLDFGALRFCEARVWAGFRKVCKAADQYFPYINGEDMKNRLPLWMKPDQKLTLADVMGMMRDHYTGTPFDMTKDVGAGPYGVPYRWRPMTWKYNDKEYFHERVTATQQTAFSWVAQMRSFMPNPIGGIFWYGLDDANLSVHAPFYIGTTSVPYAYQVGNGDILTYSETSAFWIFNRVSHTIYLFYNNAIEDVRKKQKSLSDKFVHYIKATDAAALAIYKENPEMAIQYLTEFSHNNANSMLAEWKEFGNYLLVKYLDGNIKQEKDGKFLRNQYDFPLSPKHPNYSDEWKKTIIESTGDKFLIPPK